MWLLILAALLGQPEQCNSTIFGMDNDRYAGQRARYLRRPVDPQHDVGVAHRSLPLGSLVLVTVRAGMPDERSTFAVVIDRGPYGRIDADGSWYNGADEYRACREAGKNPFSTSCYRPGSRWNGCLDTTPRLAELLGHDGWEFTTVIPILHLRVPSATLLQLWGGNV